MKFVERKDTIKLPPIDESTLKEVHFSSEMVPYQDNEHTFLGYTRCKSNVLADADRNDSARRAMRKDGGGLGL